ncbi:MAG: hypothetical protein INQ03_13215 [Candidatus Heimdallarchaeota archaeon]|nr:hypothetical protein [Candidatus Heimdallarchaeota archaeon]
MKKQVLIVPIALDPYRATICQVAPDIVYLITQHDNPDMSMIDKARDKVKYVHNYFSRQNIQISVRGARDYFDMFELIALMRQICEKHHEDIVEINVGSGSKLAAMAGIIISGMYENTSSFYPKSALQESRDGGFKIRRELWDDDDIDFEFIRDPLESTTYLPSFPITPLSKKLIPILQLISQHSSTKKEILEYCIKIKFIDIYQEINGRKRSDQSLYNILKRNFIDPLQFRHLIHERQGNIIEITETGKNMLTAFGKDDFFEEII